MDGRRGGVCRPWNRPPRAVGSPGRPSTLVAAGAASALADRALHRTTAVRQCRMRALNERRRDRRVLQRGAVRALHCECDDPTCHARIGEMSTADYECVRAASVLFLIVPDHENPETQAVVVEQQSFAVVALVARESRRVAQARDPRTPPRGIASAA